MQTIKTITEELARWVREDEFHSPSEWLDQAANLSVLLPDLSNEKTKAEIMFEQTILDIMDNAEKKMSKAEAESRAKVDNKKVQGDMSAYMYYKYLDNKEKGVMALLQIAKKKTETNI